MRISHYTNNGRIAIVVPGFGKLTTNVDDVFLMDDEIIVKTYSENESWAQKYVDERPETFIPTGGTASFGFVTCPIYKFVDPRVKAIRENEKVGHGSCSAIDECYTDAEIAKQLNEENIETPEDAVAWALEDQKLYLEQGLNQRWGEDDDEQLQNYREF